MVFLTAFNYFGNVLFRLLGSLICRQKSMYLKKRKLRPADKQENATEKGTHDLSELAGHRGTGKEPLGH